MLTAVDQFAVDYGLSGAIRKTARAGRVELCALFAACGYTRGAEVGVWTGLFSHQLCASVPGLHLLSVDPWQSYKNYNEPKNNQGRLEAAYAEARERLSSWPCTILRESSVVAARSVPDGSLDFVYIDANHEEAFVRQDLEAWVPKVRAGGIVAGHDYKDSQRKNFIQVKAAVDAFISARRIGPVYVLAADKAPSFFWVVA